MTEVQQHCRELYHASSVVFEQHGILLRGPSGVGKSDIALRLLEFGGSLLADDRTELFCREGKLWASVPSNIAGLMEVRGLGVVSVPDTLPSDRVVPVSLVVDLVESPNLVERMPETTECHLLDVAIPQITVYGFAASAPNVIRAALDVIIGRRTVIR